MNADKFLKVCDAQDKILAKGVEIYEHYLQKRR